MSELQIPALMALRAEIGDGFVFGQVLIQPEAGGFRLRHVADRDAGALTPTTVSALRQLAQFTTDGAFRPLKTAPNLRRGWETHATSPQVLEDALRILYPGAVADWFAARQPEPPVTHFRAFAERQTGMYRIAAMLSDEQAARVARAGCDAGSCVRRRMWTVPGAPADDAAAKSVIPCLEPCPVVLEFARKGMRIEQEEPVTMTLAPSDLATIREALALAAARPDPAVREGDLAAPGNARRARLALAKLDGLAGPDDDSNGH